MNEVLSQNEIDNLLSAVEMEDFGNAEDPGFEPVYGYDEPYSKSTRGAAVKMYDFRRPDKFSKDQIRTVQMMHETFSRLTTASLAAQLRSFVNVHVASVDQLTYEEFCRSVPNPTTLATINMDPLKGSAVMEIDPTITFAMIDRLFGGEGESLRENRELTDIEQSVIEGTIIRILGNLREAWSNVIDLRPKLGNIETNIQFAQIVPPGDMIVLVTMETRIGEVEGMMNFAIPYMTIESIMGRLSAQYWYSTIGSSSIDNSESDRLMAGNIEKTPVELMATLGSVELPFDKVSGLKPGDMFKLKLYSKEESTNYPLYVAGKHKFNFRLQKDRKNARKSLVITKIIKKNFIKEELPERANDYGELEKTIDMLHAEIDSYIHENNSLKLEHEKELKSKESKLSALHEALNKKDALVAELKRNEKNDSKFFSFLKIKRKPKLPNTSETARIINHMVSGEDSCDRRKAAIILLKSEPNTRKIIRLLPEEVVEALTFEIARMEQVPNGEVKSAVSEFLRIHASSKKTVNGGIGHAHKLLERSLGPQKAMDIVNRLTSSLQVKPFDFVRRVDSYHLASLLQPEHPQAIALVMSYLDNEKASAILAQLPIELQPEVIKRISKMDRTAPEILREVERVIERKLSTLASEDFASAGGIDASVEILEKTATDIKDNVIECLDEEDPELSEELKKNLGYSHAGSGSKKRKRKKKGKG